MKKIIFALIVISAISCEQVNDSQAPERKGDWLIPVGSVFDGGPGQDGIPALSNPQFSQTLDIHFMNDDELIIVGKFDGKIRGYPHKILDWHEIANDQINQNVFAVTYCPLTGSALGWERILNGKTTTFGVSGLLYNSNLIPYDRLTGSRWSQMLSKCVNGELIGSEPKKFQLVEMTWKTFWDTYKDATVINTETGYNRNYDLYPYGNYKDENSLLFPIEPADSRLPWKERVLGVAIGSIAKSYRVNVDIIGNDVIVDTLAGVELIVVRNAQAAFGAAFYNELNGNRIDSIFAVQDEFPVVMQDKAGNKYDFFGEVLSGPNQGAKLKWMDSYISFWIAWAGFHPGVPIYQK